MNKCLFLEDCSRNKEAFKTASHGHAKREGTEVIVLIHTIVHAFLDVQNLNPIYQTGEPQKAWQDTTQSNQDCSTVMV